MAIINNEKLRERIRQTINEGKGNLFIPPEIEDLLTSICFVMYEKGINDCLIITKISNEVLLKEINK